MRVLFGCWPGYGHLLPMVPLIRAAQQAGHDVVVSAGDDMAALIGQLGVAAHRSGVTLAESYDRMPDYHRINGLPAEEQPGFAARHLFGAGAVDRAHAVSDLLGRVRPAANVAGRSGHPRHLGTGFTDCRRYARHTPRHARLRPDGPEH